VAIQMTFLQTSLALLGFIPHTWASICITLETLSPWA